MEQIASRRSSDVTNLGMPAFRDVAGRAVTTPNLPCPGKEPA
jgi:hypothetical protein